MVSRATDNLAVPLLEVFSGIQGEGLLVGERQVFVRTVGCELGCRFCDTPASRGPAAYCRLELAPGSREFEQVANPVPLAQVAAALARLQEFPALHHSVALTGGEPLHHPNFVRALAPAARQLSLQLFLETNGTLSEALADCLEALDWVAMDLKLPSATGRGELWAEHERFLAVLQEYWRRDGRVEAFAKAVVARETSDEEIGRVASLAEAVGAGFALVLQPVTRCPGGPAPPKPRRLLQMQAQARRIHARTLVIPQVHRLMAQD